MNDATNAQSQFRQRLDQVAADTESLLDRLLGSATLDGERARPRRVMDAMRYASLGGGKRLRPFLVVETAALFKAPREQALMAGAALECVHCYSLAHDDLPAMDNDDLRRGRPTAHKKFDEATAILAGDGLLTLAFDILARPETHPNAAVRIALVAALGWVSGRLSTSKAKVRSPSPARIAVASSNFLCAVGRPRRRSSSSIAGRSSCTSE